MVWLAKKIAFSISRLARKLACLTRGHALDLSNKRCARCLEPAPMCEWCGKRLATMVARIMTSGGSERAEHVCRDCVVP